MSEENTQNTQEATEPVSTDIKLDGLYAFKMGMSSIYDEDGKNVPVTVLRYEPWIVSQVKTTKRDGYEAVQIACRPKKETRTSGAQKGHLKSTDFENGAYFVREMRQSLPEGVEVGKKIALASLVKGDVVKMTAKSKGHGFSGVVKRWGFAGGPASHGSGFHRRPGSIGNCEFPGRVMPGRKMPGHFGVETCTIVRAKIVDVIPEENVVLVKGAVPGSKNTLVKLVKA